MSARQLADELVDAVIAYFEGRYVHGLHSLYSLALLALDARSREQGTREVMGKPSDAV